MAAENIKKVVEFISLTTLVYLFASVLGYFIFYRYYPHLYFDSYAIIPAMFMVLLWVQAILAGGGDAQDKKKTFRNTMIFRIARILVLLLLLVLFLFVFKVPQGAFAITFLAFYILYMVFETWSFKFFGLAGDENK